MHQRILVLIAIMPVLNFLHESGHWLGGRMVGAEPVMLLQRVDIENESKFSVMQTMAYNWGGPVVNYSLITAGIFYTPLAPIGMLMACHRLGPNVFATTRYLMGNREFTTDETKQISQQYRLAVALLFSLSYLILALKLAGKGFGGMIWVLLFSGGWVGYLLLLDKLDAILS
jgi:hypothetical protein